MQADVHREHNFQPKMASTPISKFVAPTVASTAPISIRVVPNIPEGTLSQRPNTRKEGRGVDPLFTSMTMWEDAEATPLTSNFNSLILILLRVTFICADLHNFMA